MVAFFVSVLLEEGGFNFLFLLINKNKNSLAAKQLNNFSLPLIGLNKLNYIFIKWPKQSLRVFLY